MVGVLNARLGDRPKRADGRVAGPFRGGKPARERERGRWVDRKIDKWAKGGAGGGEVVEEERERSWSGEVEEGGLGLE